MGQDKHNKHVTAQGLVWSRSLPGEDVRNSPFYGVLTAREKHCLGYRLHSESRLSTVDVYQSSDRGTESIADGTTDEDRNRCVAGPILPGSKLWLVFRNRLAVAEEHLNIQGLVTARIPRERLAKVSSNTMCDLAGNAFNGGSFATMLLGLLLGLPLVQVSIGTSASDEDGAEFVKFCADLMGDD